MDLIAERIADLKWVSQSRFRPHRRRERVPPSLGSVLGLLLIAERCAESKRVSGVVSARPPGGSVPMALFPLMMRQGGHVHSNRRWTPWTPGINDSRVKRWRLRLDPLEPTFAPGCSSQCTEQILALPTRRASYLRRIRRRS